jgi:hypothetical protein
LVGRYACGEPAFRGGPFEREHMVYSGQLCRVPISSPKNIPVNVLPNTNSFGGTSSLGVVVFVIESLEGSISWSFTVDADSA